MSSPEVRRALGTVPSAKFPTLLPHLTSCPVPLPPPWGKQKGKERDGGPVPPLSLPKMLKWGNMWPIYQLEKWRVLYISNKDPVKQGFWISAGCRYRKTLLQGHAGSWMLFLYPSSKGLEAEHPSAHVDLQQGHPEPSCELCKEKNASPLTPFLHCCSAATAVARTADTYTKSRSLPKKEFWLQGCLWV